MTDPKVTECWTWGDLEGRPNANKAQYDQIGASIDRPAILLWREDYDAMRKELEELRKNRTISLEKIGWSKEPTVEAHDDEEAK